MFLDKLNRGTWARWKLIPTCMTKYCQYRLIFPLSGIKKIYIDILGTLLDWNASCEIGILPARFLASLARCCLRTTRHRENWKLSEKPSIGWILRHSFIARVASIFKKHSRWCFQRLSHYSVVFVYGIYNKTLSDAVHKQLYRSSINGTYNSSNHCDFSLCFLIKF